MTTVNLEEFTLCPGRYLAATAAGDVVVTQNGEPWVVLRSIEGDQDRLSAAYANSAEFHALIEQRRQEQAVPWDMAKKQLDLDR
jgi:prevent-host-death family protein